MGIENGIIIVDRIDTYRDALTPSRIFQTRFTEQADIQDTQQRQHAGFESRPPIGSKVAVVEIGNAYKLAVAEDDNVLNSTLGAGETIVYSSESSVVKAFVKFLNTGILEINGDADFAVRYNELNTKLQLLVTAINTALGTKADGTGTAGSLTLDISTAKVNEVKLP